MNRILSHYDKVPSLKDEIKSFADDREEYDQTRREIHLSEVDMLKHQERAQKKEAKEHEYRNKLRAYENHVDETIKEIDGRVAIVNRKHESAEIALMNKTTDLVNEEMYIEKEIVKAKGDMEEMWNDKKEAETEIQIQSFKYKKILDDLEHEQALAN